MEDCSIQKAKQWFRERNPYWAKPLIDSLNAVKRSLSFKWAVESLMILIPLLRPNDYSKHMKWISELVNLSTNNAKFETIFIKAEEIWFHPGRDVLQAGISRLFSTLAYYSRGEENAHKELYFALATISLDFAFQDEFIEIFIEQYRKMIIP